MVVTPATAQIRAGDTRLFVAMASTEPLSPGSSNNPRPSSGAGIVPTNTTVTWSVSDIPGGNTAVGTIDAKGLYTAPVTLPNPNSVKVTATSTAQPSETAVAQVTLDNPIPMVASVSPSTISVGNFTLTVNGSSFVRGAQVLLAGTALQTTFNSTKQLTATGTVTQTHVGNMQISVRNPDPGSAHSTTAINVQVSATQTQQRSVVSVAVSPGKAVLQSGLSQQFTAAVTGTTNTAVRWLAGGIAGGNVNVGRISPNGMYTAPGTIPPNGSVLVTATSLADSSGSASAEVQFVKQPATVTISIFPTQVSLPARKSQQFTATVGGTSNAAVIWAVNGVVGGNALLGLISATGLYTTPASIPETTTLTITARSSYDSNSFANANALITATPGSNFARIYYVDCAAPDDSKDGLSPATAWRTLAKVNRSSFSAGDSVLFNRGCTWREQLTIPSSGSSGSPITFGDYGSGAVPTIAGSDAITDWIEDSGSGIAPSIPQVYSAPSSFMPVALFRSGAMLASAKPAFNQLNKDGDWYYDGAHLYLYSTHDPATDLLEATNGNRSYGICVAARSYVTIQHIQVRQASGFNVETNASKWIIYSGVESLQAQSSGFNIENGSTFITIGDGSRIHDNGLGQLGDRNGIGIGSFGDGSSNITVQDSDIYHNLNHNIEVARTDKNAVMAHLIFQRNRIHDGVAAGIYIGGAHTGVSVNYNQIYKNAHQGLILAEGTGQPTPGSPTIEVYNNDIWGNGTAGGMTNANVVFPSNSTAGATLFLNNIVAEANGDEMQVMPGADYSGDYNLFYRSTGNAIISWHNTKYNLVGYRATSLQDTHSAGLSPKLKDPVNGDFSLLPGSAAINAGTNLGSPNNWALDPRSIFPWSLADQNTFSKWVIGSFAYWPQ